MNSSRTFSFIELNACQKKEKEKEKRVKGTFAQNVKRRLVSKTTPMTLALELVC